MSDIEVPVLIIGGGGAGLTASMTLSTLGIDSLLVSSLPGTSTLPKAHVLNQRAMEIFTEVGVAPEIYTRSTPAQNMRATGWYAGLAGPHDGETESNPKPGTVGGTVGACPATPSPRSTSSVTRSTGTSSSRSA